MQWGHVLQEVRHTPDRLTDQTATWSLMLLRQVLRQTDLSHIANETIRQAFHEYGYSYQRTRTWYRTGYAQRVCKSGMVTVYDQQTPEKLIELACEQVEAGGIVQLNEDEAGPYQSIPPPGTSWQTGGHSTLHLMSVGYGQSADAFFA